MAMFPASWDGALEKHGVLMGWEMKLLEEAAQMPMVSVSVLSTLPPSYTLASSAFSIARTRRILAKSQSELQGLFYTVSGQSVPSPR